MATKSKEVAKANPFPQLDKLSPKLVENLDSMSPRIVEMVRDVAGSFSEVEDTFQVSMSILDRILSAENEEEVFASIGALTHAREVLLNVPVEVIDLRWNLSTFEGETSLGFYAVFDYVDLRNNNKGTASIGSLNCMAQLYQLAKLEKLPYECKLAQSLRPTQSGFYPLFFIPITEDDREHIGDTEYLVDDAKFDPADEGK